MAVSRTALSHGAMLLFTALIATSFTVGGLITHEAAPEAVTFLRFLLAGLIFLAAIAAQGKLAVPDLSSAGRYAVIGGLLAIFFVTMFEALRWTDPVATGAMFTLVPALSALIAMPLIGQRHGVRVWAGLLIGCAGAIWVLFDGDWQKLLGFQVGYGEAIFIPGCIAYAAYSPTVRKLHRGESLVEINFFAIVAGAALTGLYGFASIAETPWMQLPWWTYLGIAHLAVFTTAISFMLIKFASLNLPSAKVMAYTYLLPAFIVAYEGLIGHGWPQVTVLAGIAVTVTAVAVIESDP